MARFSSLPHAVQVHIFGLLPMDVRLRCIEVCRGWRIALQDTAAWKHITLPDVQFTGVNVSCLFGSAVAYAQGQLETLDLSNLRTCLKSFLDHTVFDRDTDLQPQLRELRLGPTDFRDSDEILHILEKAPQLQLLSVASRWSHIFDRDGNHFAHLEEMYRGIVRIRTLGLDFEVDAMDDDELQALFTRIRRVVGELAHQEFTALYIDFDFLNETILDFVADLAASHEPALCLLGLEQFENWPDTCLDTTLRLLRLNAVQHFDTTFWSEHLNYDAGSDDPAIWSEICAAVRDCTSLRTVVVDPRLSHVSAHDARQFTAALAGHPSIACIVLHDEDLSDDDEQVCVDVQCSREYGRGLAVIVAANAPALRRLRVCDVALEDDGMQLLLCALARNTHLKQLSLGLSTRWGCYCKPDYIPWATLPLRRLDFVDNWLIPSVRQNRGLRLLDIEADGSCFDGDGFDDEVAQQEVWFALQTAAALVADRSDPKVLAAARNWRCAYRRWTTPRTQS